MGTMIQSYQLSEADYRGDLFREWPRDLKGNNDLLSLTQPGIIRAIHAAYLEAGADILETNSFNSTAVSLADYGMEHLVYELNRTSAGLAREVANEFERSDPESPRFVAGVLGPTNRTASLSPDVNGRTLPGQTTEAFWNSVGHGRPLSVGLNCALGAKALRQYVQELSRIAPCYVSTHPNAGLPNEFGQYDESPEYMAGVLREFAESGLVNLVGGCCGTTPAHIRAIAEAVAGLPPRVPASPPPRLRLSGLEPLTIGPESIFVNIGERTNVTGSRKFAQLVLGGSYEAGLEIARQQVENGAQMIDVNMDEGMLNSEAAMSTFIQLLAAEPDISRVPVVIDSSKWSVIEAGLRCIQGKGIVNSISLKEGEEEFVRQATLVRRYGAAVIVMAFDEQGQADTVERKVAICTRCYRILTERVGFPA